MDTSNWPMPSEETRSSLRRSLHPHKTPRTPRGRTTHTKKARTSAATEPPTGFTKLPCAALDASDQTNPRTSPPSPQRICRPLTHRAAVSFIRLHLVSGRKFRKPAPLPHTPSSRMLQTFPGFLHLVFLNIQNVQILIFEAFVTCFRLCCLSQRVCLCDYSP
jgi:hypothetical protein